MRRKYFFFFRKAGFRFAQLLTVSFAQNQRQIINSGAYFYGSGTSFDSQEARDQALEELTEQIAVRTANFRVYK